MLAQEATDIGPDETSGEVEARLAPLGARLALRVIAELEAGTARGVKQDLSQVTRAPKMTKERGTVDWTRTAKQVCDHVRAMQPWPTAYTFWHRPGQPPLRLLLLRATAREAAAGEAGLAPGALIVGGAPTRLTVAAGAGVVEVLELQPAGKRAMPAAEFLRGRRPQAGDRLGPE
jgi:methionyl-tRNA formyltransferase